MFAYITKSIDVESKKLRNLYHVIELLLIMILKKMNLWIKAITYIVTENFYFETIHTTKNDIKFINHTMMQAQPCNMNGNIHVQYGIVKQKLCGDCPYVLR